MPSILNVYLLRAEDLFESCYSGKRGQTRSTRVRWRGHVFQNDAEAAKVAHRLNFMHVLGSTRHGDDANTNLHRFARGQPQRGGHSRSRGKSPASIFGRTLKQSRFFCEPVQVDSPFGHVFCAPQGSDWFPARQNHQAQAPHRRGPQPIEPRNRARRNVNPAPLPLRFRKPFFMLQQAPTLITIKSFCARSARGTISVRAAWLAASMIKSERRTSSSISTTAGRAFNCAANVSARGRSWSAIAARTARSGSASSAVAKIWPMAPTPRRPTFRAAGIKPIPACARWRGAPFAQSPPARSPAVKAFPASG